jgi:hypothetical protein
MQLILEIDDVVWIITKYLQEKGYKLICDEQGKSVVFKDVDGSFFCTDIEYPEKVS